MWIIFASQPCLLCRKLLKSFHVPSHIRLRNSQIMLFPTTPPCFIRYFYKTFPEDEHKNNRYFYMLKLHMFKILIFFIIGICVCVCSHICGGNQHRSEDSVNHPRTNIIAMWMLGIELWRAARVFNFETSLQPLYLCTFLTIVQTFMSRTNRSTV